MNLIICMTPLQVLIAQKIIALTGNQPYIAIYMSYTDNKKHRHYYELLSEESINSAYLILKNNSIKERLLTFNEVRNSYKELSFSEYSIDNVYLASIDTMFVQYILSKIKFKNLFTFDDGSANVFENSEYFIQKKQSSAKLAFKKLIGIRFNTIEDVKKEVLKHYTIYSDEKNIIDHVEIVNIFEHVPKMRDNTPVEVQKIILGQGLDTFIGEKNYKDTLMNMSKSLDVEYFFPHPRENLSFEGWFEVIDTHLVIEDYLIEKIKNNTNIKFELYTFFSSSILSLVDFGRVKVNIVYNKVLMDEFSSSYEFLATRGFNLIDLDKLS